MRTATVSRPVPAPRAAGPIPRTASAFLAGHQVEPPGVREQCAYWREQLRHLPRLESGPSYHAIWGSLDARHRFPKMEALFALLRLQLGGAVPHFAEHCGGTLQSYTVLAAARAGFSHLVGYEPNEASRVIAEMFFRRPAVRAEIAGQTVEQRNVGDYEPTHVACWSMPWPGLIEYPARPEVFDQILPGGHLLLATEAPPQRMRWEPPTDMYWVSAAPLDEYLVPTLIDLNDNPQHLYWAIRPV